MCKRIVFITLIFLCPFLLFACGEKEDSYSFQVNDTSEFELMEMFADYGSLDDMWSSLDSAEVNERLERSVNNNIDEFIIFSDRTADLINDPQKPLPELVRTDLADTVFHLVDTKDRQRQERVSSYYDKSAGYYMQGFFSYLDRLTDDSAIQVDDGYFNIMAQKIIAYILDSNEGAELNETMDDIIEDIQDEDFQEDFIDVAKLLGKLLLQADYTMHVDETDNQAVLQKNEIDPGRPNHRDTGLGNAVSNIPTIVKWLNHIMMDEKRRQTFHEMLIEMARIIPKDSKAFADSLKILLEDLDIYFTRGGEKFYGDCEDSIWTGSLSDQEKHTFIVENYRRNDARIYSDATLDQTLRELLAGSTGLFVGSDKQDLALIESAPNQDALYPLDLMAKYLRGLDLDPENMRVEESIEDLIRYDIWGRDRVADPDAWPTSHLESLLFLTHITTHHGWKDGGNTQEMGDYFTDERYKDLKVTTQSLHGHGEHTGGVLTFNDSMFSMGYYNNFGLLGMYEIGFREGDYNHLYRSANDILLTDVASVVTKVLAEPEIPLSETDRDYRFRYNQNSSVLDMMTPPSVGDLGLPASGNGGNLNGETRSGDFNAFSATGLGEKTMSAWTMAMGANILFNGEGPYYYADPDAEIVVLNGRSYRKYLRPNGKVYALVDTAAWEYVYPTDAGDMEDRYVRDEVVENVYPAYDDNLRDRDRDAADAAYAYNNKRERYNRYKAQWVTDAYMSHYTKTTVNLTGSGEPFIRSNLYSLVSNDNSNKTTELIMLEYDETSSPAFLGDTPARRLKYEESIRESDPKRACGSQEEAFYRNMQWWLTEKKNVLIIPMFLSLDIAELLDQKVAEFDGAESFEEYLESRGVPPEEIGTVVNLLNSFGTIDLGVVYVILECNGVVGVADVRKFRDNHKWARKNSIGRSTIPGDYRIEVVADIKGLNVSLPNQAEEVNLLETVMDAKAIYSHSMGRGQATPSIVGHSLPALYRLAFPRSHEGVDGKEILGSQDFIVGDSVWEKRNAVAPMLFAALAGLREYTLPYEKYNDPAANRSNVKKGIKAFLEATSPLIKPTVYYQKSRLENVSPFEDNKAPYNTWKVRINGLDEHLIDSNFDWQWYNTYQGEPYLRSADSFYVPVSLQNQDSEEAWAFLMNGTVPLPGRIYTYYGSVHERKYYQPAPLKNLINVLIDSDKNKRCEGILPYILKTRFLTKFIKVWLDSGNAMFNIEQIMTAMKIAKGEMIRINEGRGPSDSPKRIIFPSWMFAVGDDASPKDEYGDYTVYKNVRDEDIVMDEMINSLIGFDPIELKDVDPKEMTCSDNSPEVVPEGTGLADVTNWTPEDWDDFYDVFETISALLHPDSDYSIISYVTEMMNAMFVKNTPFTDQEIDGVMYALGKLFTYWNGNEWIYQGYTEDGIGPDNSTYPENFCGLYNILKHRLPVINDIIRRGEDTLKNSTDAGRNYRSFLQTTASNLEKDGLIEYITRAAETPENWRTILEDLDVFLNSNDDVQMLDSPLWHDVGNLLNDMGEAAKSANEGVDLNPIYRSYGFQAN